VPDCGDGKIVGGEQCDDGDRTAGDGCSSVCLREPGWVCGAGGTDCTETVCGDGKLEGSEVCDKGALNGLFYGDGSGCSKTCTTEPTCRNASGSTVACTTACGDGNIDAGEQCDDGNKNNGDGCSSTCNTEAGFTCAAQTVSDTEPCPGNAAQQCLVLPVTYRDFKGQHLVASGGHPDFFYMGATVDNVVTRCVPNATGAAGNDALCSGLVATTLDSSGKPVWSGKETCACSFTDWDGTGLGDYSGAVRMIRSTQSFSQWYRDTANVNVTQRGTLALAARVGGGFQFSSSNGRSVNDDIRDRVAITSGLFPLESQAETKICNLWPYWDGRFLPNCTGNQWDPAIQQQVASTGTFRNFYFTTEVRYVFRYKGGETLAFYGDDDVWVYINGRLVLDLGGTHERLSGTVSLASGNASFNVGSGRQTGNVTLGLEIGKIYEIVVFHAERHPRDSNYQLTLSGFETSRSVCSPQCGDGIVTVGEECDKGSANSNSAYGGCTTSCTFGAYCGDGQKNGSEACDDGKNTTVGYNLSGCAPGCRLPPQCGDGVLDSGEQCDAGAANANGTYGGCSTTCELNPYCGDGMPNGTEQCDDGLNTGGYGLCRAGCKLDVRCGDGALQSDFELCDDGADNGKPGKCSEGCGYAARCGDGIVQSDLGEVCDDGMNSGAYGTCAADCQAGPRCGDGVVQKPAGEACDYGDANRDGVYGGCTTRCKVGPHCGDGVIQSPKEECDDRNTASQDGCSATCKSEAVVPR
jgi:fibro-slime domain-containing protein